MTRTDAASRHIATTPASAYAALIDPDALVRWLPPAGMRGRFDHFDPRPGGTYRMLLTHTDGPTAAAKSTEDSDVVEARFIEIVPGERVVHAIGFVSDDPRFAGTMTMVWQVTATDEGALVEVRAENVPEGIAPQDHAAGLASSLANLARHLES